MKIPLLPPFSKFFKGEDIIVELPHIDFFLKDTPKEYRFIVAAIAMVEWNECYHDQMEIKEAIKLIDIINQWKKWREHGKSVELKEGKVVKGGVNKRPATPPPPRPLGEGGKTWKGYNGMR